MTGGEAFVVSISGAIVGIASKEGLKFLFDKLLMSFNRSKPTNGNGNGNGNGLSFAYRRDMKELFEDMLKANVCPVLSAQTRILESIAQTNSEIKDGIVRLVILGEK